MVRLNATVGTQTKTTAPEELPAIVKEPQATSPAPVDALELQLAADLDAENKKSHLGRIRDSEAITGLLKTAKDSFAGQTAIEPEHIAVQLLKQLGRTVSPEVESELLKSAKTNAQAGAKGMSERTTTLLLATSLKAGSAAPTPENLLQVMTSIEEPYAAAVREIESSHKLATLMKAGDEKAKDVTSLKKLLAQMPTLTGLGEELVLKAAEGRIDRAVGRNEEIEEMLISLGKRQLSSLVLTGSPGVGKTAIVEGLARMIAEGQIPGSFKNARIFSVGAEAMKKACCGQQSPLGLRAGNAKSSSIADIAAEVAQAEKMGVPVVLFIDEIHQLATGAALDDLANQLKPYLSRGALRIIGATTNEEYRKSISKDKALQDRFPEFRIAAPSNEKALEMALANMDRFAEFHGVEFDASAAQMAVDLSKYHQEMENPRAAIDWMDRAGSMVAYQIDTKPAGIRVIENEVKNTQHALEQAKTEGILDDPQTAKTRANLTKRLGDLTTKLEKIVADAAKEKGLLEQLQSLGGKLRAALEAGGEGDQKKIGELKGGIAQTRKELDLLPRRIYHLKVDGDAVAAAVSKATGVELSKIQAQDAEKFTNIEGKLTQKVIGQDHVKKALADEIKADRAKLRDMKRPIGVHLFAGPTGVGKTELAKAVANLYFGGNMIRFDCTEMQEKHELAKLKGAPPGYVGFEGGSSLAEEIRKKGGRAVLVFDEIEKAHPEIMKLLMQVMDEGRFRDNENREVDCTNVMIIFTSNLGSDTFAQYAGDGAYTDAAKAQQGFEKALNGWQTPDVLNRFTGIHVFNPLGKKDMTKILDVRMRELKKQLEDTHGITLGSTDPAKKLIIENGFSPKFGGRALNREIQQKVRVPLSEAIIGQRFGDSSYVMLDLDPKKEGELLLRRMTPDERVAAQAGVKAAS